MLSIILIYTLFGCSKDSESVVENCGKESITIDNLGEVHNYLLAEHESDYPKLKSSSRTFGDVYNEFKTLLINSEKYSTNSTIKSILSESEKLKVLNKFADIKLDKIFQKKFEGRFLTYFQNLKNIDKDIKIKMLNTTKGYSSIINSDNMENHSNSDLILAYNNVYNSSMDYWSKKGNLKCMNMSENRAIIWGDAAGAAVGLGCGGFMSILMGAAVSNMIAEAYENED